jgi:hypothetical protein
MKRYLAAYVAAVALTYTLGVVTATQSVLASVSAMGLPVPLTTRLSATGHDLVGMTGIFLPVVAGGLLVALAVAAGLGRVARGLRTPLLVLAGAVTMLAVHLGLKAAFDITPIAIARTGTGLAVQALCGACGGYLFARLTPS